MKKMLALLGLVFLAGCSSNVITSIHEEDGKYFMTVQENGGVRGTVQGYVWVGTYDAKAKVMQVRKLGEGSGKERSPE